MESFVAVGQVVQRAEQQDGINLSRSPGQMARITLTDARQRSVCLSFRTSSRRVNMQRHGLDQMHFVALFGEPQRVVARCPADIQHYGRRSGQVAHQEILRPPAFEFAPIVIEALVFEPAAVVGEDFLRGLWPVPYAHSTRH